MTDEASRITKDIDETLREWQAKLGRDEFFELGRDPKFTSDFRHKLIKAGEHLRWTFGHSLGTNAAKEVAYQRVQGLLKPMLEDLRDLERQPRGSVANTRRAQEQLDAVRRALAQLHALERVSPETPDTEAPDTPPPTEPQPPTGDDPPVNDEKAPPPQQPDPSPYELTNFLARHFNLTELRDLCLKVNIPYDQLNQSDTRSMAQEIVGYARRRETYGTLVAAVRELRSSAFPPAR